MTNKNALLSVYDKVGIVDFARALTELGWNLYSSGGTAHEIAKAGIAVTDVAELTGYPAMLGHRVVTLHPKVHGGILARLDNDDDLADVEDYHLTPFGLVVVNLYPFEETVASDASFVECIEKIDVGGPTMVRAAAKNHAHVGVVTSSSQYAEVLDELREHGTLSDELRRQLALQAFRHTAEYDAAIVGWLEDESTDEFLPESKTLTLERVGDPFRYGENPHQAGRRYRVRGSNPWHDRVLQLSGLPMSYLNWFDVDAAWLMVHRPEWGGAPACAIIKHANACGFALGLDPPDPNPVSVYQQAYDCDPRSAFGGIVALNYPVNNAVAEAMVAAAQADVIIAPSFSDQAIQMLKAKRKNTRLLSAPPPEQTDNLHLRQLSVGTFLVQEAYRFDSTPESWQVVTERQPTPEELADGVVAWVICGLTKSNAIVLARGGVTWGIGAGQQNRVESGQIAADKANGRAAGGACASDAFYPFPDGIEAAASAGATLIVQPGGSVNDDQNIAKANELGVSMVFTGERQFRH